MKERIQNVPIRIVFESALELMGSTEIGTFKVTVGYCRNKWRLSPVYICIR